MDQITAKPAPATRSENPISWLHGEIDRMFDNRAGTRGLFDIGQRLFGTAPNPAIEIKEGDKDYRLTAELPGLTETDVTLELADNLLTISGEKKKDEERETDSCVVSERRYGAFRRRISVPSDVDPARIEAHFAAGVLTVVMPKNGSAVARARRIAIES